MAMKNVLKQPEKNAQRDPGEKGWACYYCGKEGRLKWDCPQASKPPRAPRPVCKEPQWKRDWPQRRRFQGSDSQDNQDWRCPGVPTQAPVLITPEEPRVLIIVGGPIRRFPFRYWGNLLRAYWSPWPTFFPIRFRNGTVWMSLNVLLQCFCQLWLGFGAISHEFLMFTWVSDCARISLTPFGCFHCFPIYFPWSDGTGRHDLHFLNVEL